jgi:hypothetical protein
MLEKTKYFKLNSLCKKVEKVMLLFHVETHKNPGLKLFQDSEWDSTKLNKITNLD